MSDASAPLPPAPGANKRIFDNFKDGKSRMLIILGGSLAAGAIGIAFLSFGGSAPPERSTVTAPPRLVSEAGGSEQLNNPAVRQAVENENMQRAQAAIARGGSAVPTINSTPVELPDVSLRRQERPNDPPRQPDQDPMPSVVPRVQPPQQPVQAVQPRGPQVDERAMRAIEDQMRTLLGGWGLRESLLVNSFQGLGNGQPGNSGASGGQGMAEQMGGSSNGLTPGPSGQASGFARAQNGMGMQQGGQRLMPRIARAGDIHFGRTINGAISSAPTPVLVEITSGPLTGARLVGTFQKTDDGLVISFRNLSMPSNTPQVRISAVAVNPSTNLPQMATSIDRMWFERYVVRLAAAFGAGLAEAYSRAGTTITQNPFGGVSQAYPSVSLGRAAVGGAGRVGESLAREIDQMTSDRDIPIISLEAGKDVAVVFTDDAYLETR